MVAARVIISFHSLRAGYRRKQGPKMRQGTGAVNMAAALSVGFVRASDGDGLVGPTACSQRHAPVYKGLHFVTILRSPPPDDDVLINIVCPGLIETEAPRPRFDDISGEVAYEQVTTLIVDLLLMPPGTNSPAGQLVLYGKGDVLAIGRNSNVHA